MIAPESPGTYHSGLHVTVGKFASTLNATFTLLYTVQLWPIGDLSWGFKCSPGRFWRRGEWRSLVALAEMNSRRPPVGSSENHRLRSAGSGWFSPLRPFSLNLRLDSSQCFLDSRLYGSTMTTPYIFDGPHVATRIRRISKTSARSISNHFPTLQSAPPSM